MIARVASLHIYPIKGCRGISVDTARVQRSGLEFDRRYMIADEAGVFVTQRTERRLCLVSTEILGETIAIRAAHAKPIEIPLTPPSTEKIPVSIWRDNVLGVEWNPGSAWFSEFLGRPVSLVYIADQDLRTVNQEHAAPDDRVGFADAYPLLAIGHASLDDLRSRMTDENARAMTMNRFRPNVCLEGLLPFEEDELSSLSVGSVSFRAPKLCDRCVVTTVDPETGQTGREPLRTLATYRKWDGAVWFGVNWIPQNSGVLRIGDALTVEERRPQRAVLEKSPSDG